MENQSLRYRVTELEALNVRIVEEEQRGGVPSITFFEDLLADDLIFRRASGTVVGNEGVPGGLEGGWPLFLQRRPGHRGLPKRRAGAGHLDRRNHEANRRFETALPEHPPVRLPARELAVGVLVQLRDYRIVNAFGCDLSCGKLSWPVTRGRHVLALNPTGLAAACVRTRRARFTETGETSTEMRAC